MCCLLSGYGLSAKGNVQCKTCFLFMMLELTIIDTTQMLQSTVYPCNVVVSYFQACVTNYVQSPNLFEHGDMLFIHFLRQFVFFFFTLF